MSDPNEMFDGDIDGPPDMDDFFNDIELPPDGSVADRLVKAYHEYVKELEEISCLEAALEGHKSKANALANDTLPEMLKEMGTDIWRDPETGKSLELVTAINAQLPKDAEKRNAIFNALRPIGIEEVLGEEFNVTFSPNTHEAKILRRLLGLEEQTALMDDDKEHTPLSNHECEIIDSLRGELKLDKLPATEKLGVHPSTLKRWLKDQIEGGNGTAISDAGIWHGKRVQINEPKAAPKKGKRK